MIPKLPQGYWRTRTYSKGHPWGLGPQVVRLFDCEVNAGVKPHLAYMFAVDAYDVHKPPQPNVLLARFLRKRR